MQREYQQKITPVISREECISPKRDKTDIEHQLTELKNRSEELEKLVMNLYDRLKPVMLPDFCVKNCTDSCDEKKLEEISPLATEIRITNFSLSNVLSKINEIFSRIQI